MDDPDSVKIEALQLPGAHEIVAKGQPIEARYLVTNLGDKKSLGIEFYALVRNRGGGATTQGGAVTQQMTATLTFVGGMLGDGVPHELPSGVTYNFLVGSEPQELVLTMLAPSRPGEYEIHVDFYADFPEWNNTE